MNNEKVGHAYIMIAALDYNQAQPWYSTAWMVVQHIRLDALKILVLQSFFQSYSLSRLESYHTLDKS